ncbi:MAG: glycosyltransferase family 4 protein [Planctomycetota bacterium]|nr:MAG: glycosyltransferase family 4 protein [Planctomycetota bacterium]
MYAFDYAIAKTNVHMPASDGRTPLAMNASSEPLGDCVLSHHWLVRHRGGERVLAAIRRLAPRAPVYTLLHDPAYTDAPPFRLYADDRAPVIASWLQNAPEALRHYPKYLPLMPAAARSLRLPDKPLAICSDAALAKAMRVGDGTRLVCYCHSPPRYVWDLADQYAQTLPRPLRALWPPLVRALRRADRVAAQRVDLFIANSAHVAARIRRHYERDAVVVHPPVDLPPDPHDGRRDDFYLCVGHHVAYKRLDLAIEACERLGRRLVVVGDVPRETISRPRAYRWVEFRGVVSDEGLKRHYRSARALLFPGEEDFGIVPVEAQAHGCPVIAYGVGGARETVVDGTTGVLFKPQTVDALIAAMERADRLTFDPLALWEHCRRFRPERFDAEFRAVLDEAGPSPQERL